MIYAYHSIYCELSLFLIGIQSVKCSANYQLAISSEAGWGLMPTLQMATWSGASMSPNRSKQQMSILRFTHCGVCGSDIYHLRSGGRPADYFLCVGHEIVGTVVRLGSDVVGITIGDRVGVGAQSGACLNHAGDCEACADGLGLSLQSPLA